MNQLAIFRSVIFAVCWIVGVVYLAGLADRGWMPHDEGTLGQSAERVLLGELPHRDFDDPYTGGLSFLHALAFELFGVRLISLRWMLLIVAALWIPAVYGIACRVADPWLASLVTWTAVAWGLPLYFAALPSWYNLFLATFGTWALLRYLDSGHRRWLFVAGLCGGLSILAKSIGLYYVAAVLLFLIFREQELAARQDSSSASVYRTVVALGLTAFCGLVALVTFKSPGVMAVLHFLVPPVALCGLLMWREKGRGGESSEVRFDRLLRLGWPFGVGVALPIAIFVVPFIVSDSLGELLLGVFVLPQKRFQFTALPLPPLSTLVAVLPMVVVFVLPFLGRRIPGRLAAGFLAAVAAVLLVFGGHEVVHRGVWASVRPLIPLAVITGCFLLASRGRGGRAPRRQGAASPVAGEGSLFLLLAMVALTSLVQIPDAFAVYFGYTAPFAVLALLFVSSNQPRALRHSHFVVLVFFLLFAGRWLHGSLPAAMGTQYWPVSQDARLEIERGGLRMPARMADAYRQMVEHVQAHSAAGDFIYASPDSPEVYFLTGRRNPTRTFFDFFEDDFGNPEARGRRLLAMLEAKEVDVVVFKQGSQFSGQRPDHLPEVLIREVAIRYPRRFESYPYIVYSRTRSTAGDATRQPIRP